MAATALTLTKCRVTAGATVATRIDQRAGESTTVTVNTSK